MRIRPTLIAPAILTIGTVGSLVAGPVFTLTAAATPTVPAVAIGAVSPGIMGLHA